MASTRVCFKLALALAAVVLAGCRTVVDTRLNKDCSGELRTSIVFSAEEKQNFDNAPENAGKSICDQLRTDAPPETVFVEELRDGETYCTTLRAFHTVKDLRSLYDAMLNVTVNELRMGLGSFVFDVQVDLTAQNETEAVAQEWRLTLPGEIGNHNADVVERNTLVWKIAPGETRTLQAESALGPDTATQVLVGGVIISLGSVFAVWLAKRIARQNAQRNVATQSIIYPPTR